VLSFLVRFVSLNADCATNISTLFINTNKNYRNSSIYRESNFENGDFTGKKAFKGD